MQNRMLSTSALLRPDAWPTEVGYALSPIKQYERSKIKASPLLIKEWDYYLVSNDHFALALTVSDNGYMGLDSVSVIDFDQKLQKTQSFMQAFPLGKKHLPSCSESGVTRALGRNHELTFRVESGRRQLYGHVYDFFGPQQPLLFDIVLNPVKQDSMVIVTPFHKPKRGFYYNRKLNCLPAEGRVIMAGNEALFSPVSSFAVLDWGRGVWPHKVQWYWAQASGLVHDKRFGFNFGYGFGDCSAATENMLFFDGIAHKLGNVDFACVMKDGQADYLSPWQVSDDWGRVELEFIPILDRAAKMDYHLLGSDQHQVFGRFHGRVILDDGTLIEVKDLTGFLEKVVNKW